MVDREKLSRIERGLIPGERYTARVRAVSRLGVKSDWSDSVDFVTKEDLSTPDPPFALTLGFERSTLVAEWNPPETNTDGTLLRDLSHFKLVISSGGTSATYTTSDNYFLYTVDQNERDFASIGSTLTVSVVAVDVSGNESTAAVSSVSNSTPLKPQDPVLDVAGTAITITMNGDSQDKDIIGYKIERSTSAGSGFSEIAEVDSKSYISVGSPSTTYYFRYRVIDFFGQISPYSNIISTTTAALQDRAHSTLSELYLDDHTQYSRADGTRAFTGEVAGVTPTVDASLSTKGYVDSTVDTHATQLDPHSNYLPKVSPVNTVAASGSTTSISFNTEVHDITMDQNCTFSFADAPVSGNQASVTVIVRGSFTPSWPAPVIWDNGSEPSYVGPAVYSFLTVDGGSTVFGFAAGMAMA